MAVQRNDAGDLQADLERLIAVDESRRGGPLTDGRAPPAVDGATAAKGSKCQFTPARTV